MKLQKFKTDAAGSAIGTALGVTAGAMLSGGISGVIPIKNQTIAKAIVAVTGVALATLVGGQDTAAKAVRNIGIGMTAQQGKELISDAVKPMLPANTGMATKFLHDTMGGGGHAGWSAPSVEGGLSARLARARMGNPDMFAMATPEISHGGFAAI